jgi:(p)ppGpp synthase/HD superfamily hydrolase
MELAEAFLFACRKHAGAHKKGTTSPFIYHPLAVAALVLKYGGSEDQAKAALLHDTIADGDLSIAELRDRFGEPTARLVATFADPPVTPEVAADWQKLRQAYLVKLSQQTTEALLVVACEELHEITELLNDFRRHGAAVWQRYPVSAGIVYWYFRELLILFRYHLTGEKFEPIIADYAQAVRRFKDSLFEGRP